MKHKNLVLTRQDRRLAFEVFDIISSVTNVPHETFVGNRTRKNTVVILRQISSYLLKRFTSLSQAEIGNVLGGYDHSTVIHSIKTVNNWLESPKIYKTETRIIDECVILLEEKYGLSN